MDIGISCEVMCWKECFGRFTVVYSVVLAINRNLLGTLCMVRGDNLHLIFGFSFGREVWEYEFYCPRRNWNFTCFNDK